MSHLWLKPFPFLLAYQLILDVFRLSTIDKDPHILVHRTTAAPFPAMPLISLIHTSRQYSKNLYMSTYIVPSPPVSYSLLPLATLTYGDATH